jgi:HEPN domain-containing protein
LSRRDPVDLAARLARKAQADATAARKFASDPEISDDIIGFHAQQAVEKWLKAVMALRQVRQMRTHDLNRLVESLEEIGVELPVARSDVDELTVFAVPLRYEDLLDGEALDRTGTIAVMDEVGRWAAAQKP